MSPAEGPELSGDKTRSEDTVPLEGDVLVDRGDATEMECAIYQQIPRARLMRLIALPEEEAERISELTEVQAIEELIASGVTPAEYMRVRR